MKVPSDAISEPMEWKRQWSGTARRTPDSGLFEQGPVAYKSANRSNGPAHATSASFVLLTAGCCPALCQ